MKKSKFIIFHPYQKRLNYEVNLNAYDNRTNKFVNLERKEDVKYLGVLIDSNLCWKYHVSHVASKISRNIGIMASLRHFTPFSTLLNIYRSLIFPYLSYGITVWGQAGKTHLQNILVLQKRVVRLMNFVSSNIFSLPMLYFKLSSTLMLDVHNKLVPSNICDMFTLSQDIHNYNTRSSSSGNLYINYSRLNLQKNSFPIIGAKIWNSHQKI